MGLVMSMREECKHYQSRTYASGEVARFCSLGNAPDQPWACPEGCVTFEPRLADVGWVHGSLARRPQVESEPAESIPIEQRRDLLNAADEIIEAVAPDLIEERRRELDRQHEPRRGWKFWKRP
ncbi:MAG: hypothetical protein HKL87_05080 [Acidimicrobiaceae bacterium]|nr:hypothetical protein [Acidimicrobiaceae bacterium]